MLYAVLLAFAVIVVWQRFSDAEKAVAQEAGAATTIYRLTHGLDAGPRMAVQDRLNGYLESAVAKDWRAMERGRASPEVTRALDDIYVALLTFTAHDSKGAVLQAEILHQLDLITQARRERLVLASGTVPGALWMVLFGGAVLTIGFTLFFGTENLRAQMMMTGALALLICSVLLVIIIIDHPFAGPVRALPEPLSGVLEDGHASRP